MTGTGRAACVQRDSWLQKHPSPAASRGEFHWYPDGVDRELRAGFVERLRGVEPPAVLWQLAPGRVAWGQAFAATTPADGRRYVGVVLSVIEGDASAAVLLAQLALPPPAPWTEAGAGRVAVETWRGLRGDVAGVVRALLSGGVGRVAEPASPALPAWVASIERILPPSVPPRVGVWQAAPPVAQPRSVDAPGLARSDGEAVIGGGPDRVAALAAAAWRDPASRVARAWTLLCELAVARGESIDRVGAALAGIDAAAALTAAERAALASDERASAVLALAAPRSVVEVLHAWGRGRLDRSPDAASLAGRLADLVALRVLAGLAADRDAAQAIAEARWHALLPAARRTSLLAAVAQRTASLRALIEADNHTRDSHA